MAAKVRITRTDAGALLRLRKALENPQRALKRAGIVILEHAERAFQLQRLGEIEWPHRYPNMGEPFVNVAGAVQDLASGPRIKQRRFDRRPALMDTGSLLRSLSPRGQALEARGKFEVVVGSSLPYAGLHQFGGESSQSVTAAVKSNLGAYLKRQRGAIKRAQRSSAPLTREQAASRQLGWLFNEDELTTKVNARPFVGITDAAEAEMIKEIEKETVK